MFPRIYCIHIMNPYEFALKWSSYCLEIPYTRYRFMEKDKRRDYLENNKWAFSVIIYWMTVVVKQQCLGSNVLVPSVLSALLTRPVKPSPSERSEGQMFGFGATPQAEPSQSLIWRQTQSHCTRSGGLSVHSRVYYKVSKLKQVNTRCKCLEPNPPS